VGGEENDRQVRYWGEKGGGEAAVGNQGRPGGGRREGREGVELEGEGV